MSQDAAPSRADLQAALDAKAKPLGSLGRLEELAMQLGMLQGTMRPVVHDPVVAVFAGDHGAAHAVSAFPTSVTAAMVGVYLGGGAAINLLAREAGARLLVVDAGVAVELQPHPGLIAAKVAPGTQDWTRGPAMSADDVRRALQRGGDVLDRLADGGTTVVALGEMGIGNTASAALLAHKVAGLPLLVGRGAGLDEAGLERKQAAVALGSARTGLSLRPEQALAEYGGFEIAMLVGAIRRGAQRGVCLVIDGVIVTAAALVAATMDGAGPVQAACVFAHRSAEPGHDAMLAYLGAHPLLDLGLRLGEGTGAALAIPLLRVACAVLGEMADLADL